ncbi:Zinc finger, C3HC4 type (RING finger)/RING-type zinc-finger containing protein, putative [Leishmania lindenbergi]|uniref:Zinc finger, C3HC4 type (RING finger)/RING-type zinc-finger containing protein n=1 Tax=Leishmania lindenbergi TaxID=651832 RepID=A0AAW3B197_9TRYP
MNKNTCTAVHVPAHIECQVCYDTWTNPVQLLKCGHIFCRNCAPPATTRCAICHSTVAGFAMPSEGIIEASMNVPVLCTSCGWRGTRKASLSHQCNPGQTHSLYITQPPMTDREWVEFALQGRNHVVVDVATGSVHQDALPPSVGISTDTVQGIPL